MTIMFCAQCGNPREQVEWGASRLAKFCGKCGHPYDDGNVAGAELPDHWKDQVYEESSEGEQFSSDDEVSEKPLRKSPPRRPVPVPPTNGSSHAHTSAASLKSTRSPPAKAVSSQKPPVSSAKALENSAACLSRTQLGGGTNNPSASTFPRPGVKQSPSSQTMPSSAHKKPHKRSPSSHLSGLVSENPSHMRNFSKPPVPPSPKALNFKSPKRFAHAQAAASSSPQAQLRHVVVPTAAALAAAAKTTTVQAPPSPRNGVPALPQEPSSPRSPTSRPKKPGHGRWSSRGRFPNAKNPKAQNSVDESNGASYGAKAQGKQTKSPDESNAPVATPAWVSKAQEKQKRRDELQLFSEEREIKERNAALASKGKPVPSHPETVMQMPLSLANIPYADGSISDLGIDGASFCAAPSSPLNPGRKAASPVVSMRGTPRNPPESEQRSPVNGQRRGSFVTRATSDDGGAIPGSEMQLAELQKKFYSDIHLVADRRSLIREGVLRKLTRRGPRPYHFHLFTDIIIYSDSTPVGYKIHRVINLNTVQVEDIDFASVKKDRQFSYAFKFLSREKSFLILAQSQDEKLKWLGDIRKCLAPFEARNRGDSVSTVAPLWTPDEMSDACQICSREFSLMIRKHHCRRCGSLVCSSCSPNRVVVPHIDHKPVRVCTRCQSDVSRQDSSIGGGKAAHFHAKRQVRS